MSKGQTHPVVYETWTNKSHVRSYLLIFSQRTRERNYTQSAGLVLLAANVETSVAMFDDIAQHVSKVGLTAALELTLSLSDSMFSKA